MPNKMLPRSPRLARLVQLRRSAAAADECPTRVRRLVAPDMVTAAYGRGADARVPAEIVDYAGGARSVQAPTDDEFDLAVMKARGAA